VRLRVLVDFFLAVAARVVAFFALEGLLAVLLPAVARAGFFSVAVEAAALPVVAFLRVARLVVVPSWRGFSSRERCTAMTSL